MKIKKQKLTSIDKLLLRQMENIGLGLIVTFMVIAFLIVKI